MTDFFNVDDISNISKWIGVYELITILLTIAVGLGGVSEIVRNKLLEYPAFIIGGAEVIVLYMITFVPFLF